MKFPSFYFIHIRKTGGTYFSYAMLSNSDFSGEETYRKIVESEDHAVLLRGKRYIGWNVDLARNCKFFYCFSHLPFYNLNLSNRKIIYLTVLRDPIDRIVSHYKMLMAMKDAPVKHPCFETEGEWLGNSFMNFISNIPTSHLMNQLWMFSHNFHIDEGIENISKVDHVYYLSNIDMGLKHLSNKYELNIAPPKKIVRKSEYVFTPSESDLDYLRRKIRPEIEFYNEVKELKPDVCWQTSA